MKRLIAAVSFAALAVPAVATETGAPFEQAKLDRALPQVRSTVDAPARTDAASLPFEQTLFDRGLPNIGKRRVLADASSGETRSDREIATDAGAADSVWTNDHNFISPAQ